MSPLMMLPRNCSCSSRGRRFLPPPPPNNDPAACWRSRRAIWPIIGARAADGKLSQGAMNMHDMDRTLGHTNMEAGYEFQGEEEAGEFQAETGEVLGEEELNELATELLSVTHDRELEQFFNDVFNKV